jgi:hypothetical protein
MEQFQELPDIRAKLPKELLLLLFDNDLKLVEDLSKLHGGGNSRFVIRSTKPNNNSRRGLDMEYGSGGRKPKYSNSGDSTKRPKIDSTFQLI